MPVEHNRREELIAAVQKVGVPEAVRRIKNVVQETGIGMQDKIYELAEEFLPNDAPTEQKQALATAIQETIDEFLSGLQG